MRYSVVFLIAILSIGMMPISINAAQSITLVADEVIPYVDIHHARHGIDSEIVKEAFQRVGYTVQFKFRPWARVLKEVERGDFEAAYTAFYTSERSEVFAFSRPYNKGSLVLYKRKETPISYTTIRDLTPYTIGVVLGNVYSPEFDAATYLKKEAVSKLLQNLKKLAANRIDLLVGDYAEIQTTIWTQFPEGKDSLVSLEPPISTNLHYVIFSKKISGYEQKLRDFNSGLQQIIQDGTFEQIFRNYGINIDMNSLTY